MKARNNLVPTELKLASHFTAILCLDKMHTLVYSHIMTQAIPVTEARKNLLTLIDEVNEEYKRVDLTKNGKIKATLVSPDYLDSLEETIFSLNNSLSDIKLAEKELKEGKYISLGEIKKKYIGK